MSKTKIHLFPQFFSEKEKTLLEHGRLAASAFRFDSGVCGLRLKNEQGQLVLLPFQGQQIWSAEFGGRNLTMKSMFAEPRPTQTYLETYGAFLLHCGATAMGVPDASGGDTHPLHGELPNAPYQQAYLVAGRDEKGEFLALGGQYHHTVAFSHNYLARPLVRLYENSSLFRVLIEIQNLKHTGMELMYMAHVNFRPIDNGRLVYSAPCTPESVRVRRSIPSHIRPLPGYAEFIEDLAQNPEKHNRLAPGLLFDPEVVFYIDYQADGAGWAHTMQVHPDGSADLIRHRPDQLDKGVRWVSRTADQDALGMVLPATAEPEGYAAEKAKGNLRMLPAGGVFQVVMEMGALTPAEAARVEDGINHILSQ
jgi:hypothetical protein